MRNFDYLFLKKDITGNIVGLTEIIADLKSKEEFRKLQYEETFESLRRKAIIESVKGSNAIEGVVTTDTRIREIVAGAAPLTHDELEISGYKDALNLIHTEYKNLDIEEDTVCMFHKMTEEHTNTDNAGKYKSNNNFIMEYNADGSRRIRFKPVSAKDTASSMEQIILAFYEARQDSEISPLLLIPCFIVDFLCIHPFTDDDVIIGTSQLTQAKSRAALICPIFLSSRMGYERGRRRKQSYLRTKVGWECAAA